MFIYLPSEDFDASCFLPMVKCQGHLVMFAEQLQPVDPRAAEVCHRACARAGEAAAAAGYSIYQRESDSKTEVRLSACFSYRLPAALTAGAGGSSSSPREVSKMYRRYRASPRGQKPL